MNATQKLNNTDDGGSSPVPCSPSSDTTETATAFGILGDIPMTIDGLEEARLRRRALFEKLERERDMWKANHDNQVAIKRIIAARPDLKDRAPMVEKLMAERNRAQANSIRQHARIGELEIVIRETIMENLHLADGDVCTLKRLKDAIGFDLDSSQNAGSDARRAGLRNQQ